MDLIAQLVAGSPEAWLNLAARLGSNVPLWYAVAVAMVALSAAAAWWLARGAALRSASAGVQAALATGLVLLAGQAFGTIALRVGDPGQLAGFDTALAASLALEASMPTLHAFATLTRLGDTAVITVACIVLAVLLWRRGHHGLAVTWVVAIAGNALLNVGLKAVFERSRPLHEHGVAVAQGWSFPSGHSSGSVVVWGMLAYLALRLLPARWHLPVVVAAACLAFSVGFSRIVLQVHYFSDVLAGFCSGLAWLTLCIVVAEWQRRRGLRPAS